MLEWSVNVYYGVVSHLSWNIWSSSSFALILAFRVDTIASAILNCSYLKSELHHLATATDFLCFIHKPFIGCYGRNGKVEYKFWTQKGQPESVSRRREVEWLENSLEGDKEKGNQGDSRVTKLPGQWTLSRFV